MALDPHLFTSSTSRHRRLRDHVIDLNQSMDFDEIVTKMLATLREAAKTQPFARHFLDAHTPAERRRIVETNLRRLRVRFADVEPGVVAGASESIEDWWYQNIQNPWDEIWKDDPSEDEASDDTDAEDPDDPTITLPDWMGDKERNGADLVRGAIDDMDGK
jgi:hypothetical protein